MKLALGKWIVPIYLYGIYKKTALNEDSLCIITVGQQQYLR